MAVADSQRSITAASLWMQHQASEYDGDLQTQFSLTAGTEYEECAGISAKQLHPMLHQLVKPLKPSKHPTAPK